MVISFSSFQCKRANPPEIEDVIKIRERRSIRQRRIEDVEPLRGTVSYLDYKFMPWDGSIVPAPAHPIHIDPITHKQFKATNSPNEHEILKMFKFYGVDINKIYQCPVCNFEADMRTLLPHLNNIDRTPDVFYADESEYLGELAPKVDKPAPEVDRPVSGEVFGVSSGRSFSIVEPISSHGWNFKQIGEWMDTLGY